MKILQLLCIALLLPAGLFAADRAVDGDGNIPGSFPTIQAAVAAAVDGDRIVIYDASSFYSGTLNIDKSLTLMAASAGDSWFHDGDILITPANGRVVTISGLEKQGNILSNGNNGVGARSVVNLVDCFIQGYIDFDEDNYEVNILYSYLSGYARFRFGSMIGSTLKRFQGSSFSGFRFLHITDEPAIFGLGDTVKIVGNEINYYNTGAGGATSMVQFQNSSSRYFIAGNFFMPRINSSAYAVTIDTAYLPDSQSVFINNTILGGFSSSSGCTVKSSNFVWLTGTTDDRIQNNIFASSASNNGCTLGTYKGRYNIFAGLRYSAGVEQNFNRYFTSSDLDIDDETGFPFDYDQFKVTDRGNPNARFLDLDLSRNDCGIGGGPFSWWNYHPQDSATGRARIYDLELPSSIYDLGTGTKVKARAAHMK